MDKKEKKCCCALGDLPHDTHYEILERWAEGVSNPKIVAIYEKCYRCVCDYNKDVTEQYREMIENRYKAYPDEQFPVVLYKGD